jgi:serine/threonine protein kinase
MKPDNVLLVGDQYKLCDFGSIKTQKIIYDDLDDVDKLNITEFIQEHTTMHYRPPEMLDPRGQEIGTEADMWMLGCCLYMVAFGRHPFEDKDPVKIMNCQVSYPNEGYFTQLTRRLLVKDPKKRLTAKQVADMLATKLNSTH